MRADHGQYFWESAGPSCPVLRPAGLETVPSPALTDKPAGQGGQAAAGRASGNGELRQPVKLPPIPPEIASGLFALQAALGAAGV